MTDNQSRHKESLSGLMDGSTDELELHRLLKAVSEDDELRNTWSRYHLVRATLHNELPESPQDLSLAISAALDCEPEHNVRVAGTKLWRSFGRAAIAASVTVMAVLGVQQYNGLVADSKGAQVAAAASQQVDAPVLNMPYGFQVPPLVTRNVSSNNDRTVHYQPRQVVLVNQPAMDALTRQQVEKYFKTMMVRHAENAIQSSNRGLLPYARLPQALAE